MYLKPLHGDTGPFLGSFAWWGFGSPQRSNERNKIGSRTEAFLMSQRTPAQMPLLRCLFRAERCEIDGNSHRLQKNGGHLWKSVGCSQRQVICRKLIPTLVDLFRIPVLSQTPFSWGQKETFENHIQEMRREMRRQREQWKVMSSTFKHSGYLTWLPRREGKILSQDLVLFWPLRKGKVVGGPMRPFVVMPRLLHAWTAQGDARKDASCLFPELHRLQPKGIAYPHGIRSGKELFSFCSALHCLLLWGQLYFLPWWQSAIGTWANHIISQFSYM